LSRFSVKPGASVQRGDVIGYVGSTGRSTGAHLHYEILANGKLINPLQLLTNPSKR
jgi:murein DD-endopeptidase MepM/ murein hydrolase activator NlpD